ncbi:MAG: hypothetical protein KAX55_00620 [Propionivibrio sp.]|nr:hypothetical protein [Propionivibrio sp.]
MKNVTGKREAVTDNAQFMENSKQIFERLIQTTVSEALIADAVDLYAEQEIANEADRDEFVEKYDDAAFEPIIKKSVLDVVVAVVAAHTVENDETFKSIVDMLEAEEKDDDIRRMKVFMLRKMTDDAISDLADPSDEQVFRQRMAMMESAIG